MTEDGLARVHSLDRWQEFELLRMEMCDDAATLPELMDQIKGRTDSPEWLQPVREPVLTASDMKTRANVISCLLIPAMTGKQLLLPAGGSMYSRWWKRRHGSILNRQKGSANLIGVGWTDADLPRKRKKCGDISHQGHQPKPALLSDESGESGHDKLCGQIHVTPSRQNEHCWLRDRVTR